MGRNRDWMYERLDGKYLNKDFIRKVENEFIAFAKEEQSFKESNKMRCPCNKCWNVPYLDEDTVKLHLYKYGFRPNYFWFDGPLSRAISNTIKSFYKGQCTCLSNLPPEELQLWWSTFEGQYTWDPELTEEVKDLWLKVVGKNLRNLVNKAGKRPPNKPLVWLTEQGQERLQVQRSDPNFQKKSAQCLKNRTQGPNAATLHCQGSISTAELARRMIKEGKTPTPSALFARSHSKEDPEAGKVFIDDRSKALWEKYEALRTERGIEEGTQEAEKLYYEVSGGWSKKSTIYGLGTSATMFYEKPTASTTSTGSSYIPSAYSKIQADLQSTQQQLRDQQKLVDEQRRQFDEAMKLIHSLQSQVNRLSGSSSHHSESQD